VKNLVHMNAIYRQALGGSRCALSGVTPSNQNGMSIALKVRCIDNLVSPGTKDGPEENSGR
jgi:hypothetical protein